MHKQALRYASAMRKKFIDRIPQNTRKPEGFWRRTLLRSINHDHAAWARWGLSHLDWHHTWNVLDIGCGGGANIARMMSLCPKGLIYGIDASEESVDSSRKYNRPELDKRCFILQGTVDCLPFDVDTFDVITAFEALYSWPDLEKAFSEVYRVLKPNGYFMICCESSDPSNTFWPDHREGLKVYPADEIEVLLSKTGFIDIQIFKSGKESICITAREDNESDF